MRHREETRVVSRLTMENMNLASRCREAISQVAALKKELVVYQKRQSEWGTLQREVMLLRKQIDKSAASSANSSPSKAGTGTVVNPNNKHLKESDDKQPSDEESPDKRSVSPATDLDRIMSQQFRKQASKKDVAAAATTDSLGKKNERSEEMGTGGDKGSEGNTKRLPASSTDNSSKLTSSNTKIPISVNSVKPSTQKEDEFDADIDMVDFFAKSQLVTPSSGSPTSPSQESAHLGSNTLHARKVKGSTDDHMPGDVVPSSPSGHSPPNNNKKALADNLLSSLDAFEASFASAFPETSFSITSEAPMQTAKLDMSFEVPDFDPFFKSPTNAAGGNSKSLSDGSKSNGHKSQIQSLFPESAMNFKSSPKLDMAFDSTPLDFGPMEVKGPSESKKGKLSVNTDSKEEKSSQKQRGPHHQNHRPSPLSPQTMSAEIEQLDVIANLASTDKKSEIDPPASQSKRSSVRKVKQPVSYAEPSTKSKLRRGDVIFPKVDAADKKTGKTSPTTDLDRIMSQKMSEDAP